jgi:hypothetical protein
MGGLANEPQQERTMTTRPGSMWFGHEVISWKMAEAICGFRVDRRRNYFVRDGKVTTATLVNFDVVVAAARPLRSSMQTDTNRCP